MLQLTWTETGLEDLTWWTEHDPKMLKRVIKLCLEICQDPRNGLANPNRCGSISKATGRGALPKNTGWFMPLMTRK